MIRYKCTKCAATLESPSSLAGQKEACPVCGTVCAVPKKNRRASLLVLMICGGGVWVLIIAVACIFLWAPVHESVERPQNPSLAGRKGEKLPGRTPEAESPAELPAELPAEPARGDQAGREPTTQPASKPGTTQAMPRPVTPRGEDSRIAKPEGPVAATEPSRGRYSSLAGDGLGQLLSPAMAAAAKTETIASLVFVLSNDGARVRIESGSVASRDGQVLLIPSAFDLDVKGNRFKGSGPFSVPAIDCDGEFVGTTEARGTLSITSVGTQQRTIEGKWAAHFKERCPDQESASLLGTWVLARVGVGPFQGSPDKGQETILEFRENGVVVVTEMEKGKPKPPATGKYKVTGNRIEFTVWIKSADWNLKTPTWLEFREGGAMFGFRKAAREAQPPPPPPRAPPPYLNPRTSMRERTLTHMWVVVWRGWPNRPRINTVQT